MIGYLVCKLYQSSDDEWKYTGLAGCLLLCNDEKNRITFLRMLDLQVGVSWMIRFRMNNFKCLTDTVQTITITTTTLNE